jgi:hypothetical protein
LVYTIFVRWRPLLKRQEIFLLLKKAHSSCPRSGSSCSNVILRNIGEKGDSDSEEFELHLKWVPDEHSRNFLKAFTMEHNLGMREKGKSIIIYSQQPQITE